MAFQKGFYGVGYAGEDTGSKNLVQALGSFNKSLQKYGEYVGTELDKKVKAAAETAARVDNFKSYQDKVDSGEIENTKSDFFIAHYDNIKGQNAGSEYQTKKMMAYETFIGDQSGQDIDDVDGSGYLAWSNQYDQDNYSQYTNNSTYFMKGLDTAVKTINQQLSSKYATHNASRLKEKYALNYTLKVEDIIKEGGSDLYTKINSLDTTANEFRSLDKKSRNELVIQAFKNSIGNLANLGDLNANYDSAIALAESLKNYKRPNGSSFLVGKDVDEWNTFIEKIKTESIKHEEKVVEFQIGQRTNEFIELQEKDLVGQFKVSITNFMGKGATKASFALPRFKEEVRALVFENEQRPDDDPDKLNAQEIRLEVVDIKNKIISLYKSSGSTKNILPYDPKGQYKFVIRRDFTKLNEAVGFMKIMREQHSEMGTDPKEVRRLLLDNDTHGTLIKFMIKSAVAAGYKKEDGSTDLASWWKDYQAWHKEVSK